MVDAAIALLSTRSRASLNMPSTDTTFSQVVPIEQGSTDTSQEHGAIYWHPRLFRHRQRKLAETNDRRTGSAQIMMKLVIILPQRIH